jgi:hypothetical protein
MKVCLVEIRVLRRASFVSFFRLFFRSQITPSLTNLTLNVSSSSEAPGQPVSISVSIGSEVVAVGSGVAHEPLTVKIPSPQLWHPDSPTLYTLAINLTDPATGKVDTVGSYAGLRTLSVGVLTSPAVPATGPRIGWDNPGGACLDPDRPIRVAAWMIVSFVCTFTYVAPPATLA